MQIYPRDRCPACKEFFRLEVKATLARPFDPSLVVCPRCGLKFQRFPLPFKEGGFKEAGAS